jgi:hypothetical protein
VATSGCITRAGGSLSPISPELGGSQPRLEQAIGAFEVTLASGDPGSGHAAGRRLGEAILQRWQARGFIAGHSDVPATGFTGNADLNLTLSGERTDRGNPLLQIASALTLALLPYTLDTRYDVTVVVENVETGETYRAAVADGYRTTVELLLVLAAPLATRGEERTVDAIADHLYEQLRQQGAFDRREPETAYAGL